jgi:hypothetical protein
MTLATISLMAGGFALLTFTSRLAETRRAVRARTRESIARPR